MTTRRRAGYGLSALAAIGLLPLAMRLRDSPRPWLRMIGPALLLPLAVTGCAFAVLAISFGKPTRAQLHVATVLARLSRYQVATSRIVIRGSRPVSAICLETSLQSRARPIVGGSIVSFSDGSALLTRPDLVTRVSGAPSPWRQLKLKLDLAGCPASISARFQSGLLHHLPLTERKLRYRGAVVLVYRLGDARDGLTLVVSARTLRVLMLVERSNGLVGTSRLRFLSHLPGVSEVSDSSPGSRTGGSGV